MTRWRRRTPDIDEELRAHLALETADRIERGEPAAEAARHARRSLHSTTLTRELVQEVWGWPALERLWQDVRYALRAFAAHPGFAAVAILSLALGIGANTAAFSLADAALLRPLPVPRAGEIVTLRGRTHDGGWEEIAPPDFEDLRTRTQAFAGLAGGRHMQIALARAEDTVPHVRFGMLVTDGFFDVLEIAPARGRFFSREETGSPGRGPVAVLSHELWLTQFGGRAEAVGAAIRVNGQPFTVIGVAPASFLGLHQFLRPAVYLPLAMQDVVSRSPGTSSLDRRDNTTLLVRGRLNPGVTPTQAQSEAEALARTLAAAHPDTNRQRTFDVRPEIASRIAEAPATLFVVGLLGLLAALVLVIACANVASLLLARARARSREMAIRLAIGAGRLRLLRQLLTESLILALLGGVVGVGLAWTGIRALRAWQLPTDTPLGIAVALDARVLLAGLVATIVSALVFGLAPAWQTTGVTLTGALKTAEPPAGRTRLAGRSLLVSAQIALCLVLLVVSAALVDAFRRMLVVDPGVRADRVLMLEFNPGLVGADAAGTREFFRQLLDRAAAVPGVERAALARAIPFRPNFTNVDIVPDGYQMPADRRTLSVAANVLDGDYFATMGTALVAGRAFDTRDAATAPRVAIVNEEAASRFWPGRSAIGQRFRVGEVGPWTQVVGVARNGRYLSLAETPVPYVYLPLAQHPQGRMTLLVRARQSPTALTGAIMATVRAIDPNQPVFNVRDFRTYFQNGPLGLPRIVLQMAGAAGLVGLVLALVGVYGLVSFSVSRRTREIAVRQAIGATRGDVLRLILRQALGLALAGTAAGLVLSVPLFGALSAAVPGLGTLSPWTLVIVPVALVLVTMVASAIPARRAMAIDATLALRTD